MSGAKRATRVAAPGAVRLTLTGIVAVSDDFSRVRLLLLDEGHDGRPDPSAGALRRAVPARGDAGVPYELRDGPLPADAAGVRGACWAVPPAHRRAHWLAVAAGLRGRWARAEVTLRPYCVEGRRGVSLDLSMLEELAPRAGPGG